MNTYRRLQHDMQDIQRECAQFENRLRDGFGFINNVIKDDLASGCVSLAGERTSHLPSAGPKLVEVRGDEILYHTSIREIMKDHENHESLDQRQSRSSWRSSSPQRHFDESEASGSMSSVSINHNFSLSVDKPRVKSASPYRKSPSIDSSDVIERIRARNEQRIAALREKVLLESASTDEQQNIRNSPPTAVIGTQTSSRSKRSHTITAVTSVPPRRRSRSSDPPTKCGHAHTRPYTFKQLAEFRSAQQRKRQLQQTTATVSRQPTVSNPKVQEFMEKQRMDNDLARKKRQEAQREKELKIAKSLSTLHRTANKVAQRSASNAKQTMQRRNDYGAFYEKSSKITKTAPSHPIKVRNQHISSSLIGSGGHVHHAALERATHYAQAKSEHPMTKMAAETTAMKYLRSPNAVNAVRQRRPVKRIVNEPKIHESLRPLPVVDKRRRLPVTHEQAREPQRQQRPSHQRHQQLQQPLLLQRSPQSAVQRSCRPDLLLSIGDSFDDGIEESADRQLNAPDRPVVKTYSPMRDLADFLVEDDDDVGDDHDNIDDDHEAFNISRGSLQSLPPAELPMEGDLTDFIVHENPEHEQADHLRDQIINGLRQLDTVNESLQHLQKMQQITVGHGHVNQSNQSIKSDELLRQLMELNGEKSTSSTNTSERRSVEPRTSTPMTIKQTSSSEMDEVSTIDASITSSSAPNSVSVRGKLAKHINKLKKLYKAKVELLKVERKKSQPKTDRSTLKSTLETLVAELSARRQSITTECDQTGDANDFIGHLRQLNLKITGETDQLTTRINELREQETSPSSRESPESSRDRDSPTDPTIEVVETSGYLQRHTTADVEDVATRHVLMSFLDQEESASDKNSVTFEELPGSDNNAPVKSADNSASSETPVVRGKLAEENSTSSQSSTNKIANDQSVTDANNLAESPAKSSFSNVEELVTESAPDGFDDTSVGDVTPTTVQSVEEVSSSNAEESDTTKDDDEIVVTEVVAVEEDPAAADTNDIKSDASTLPSRSTKTPVSRRGSWPYVVKTDTNSLSENQELACRIEDLRARLANRRSTANKLRQEYKRHTEQHTQYREASLKRQIELYDGYIETTEGEIHSLERSYTTGQMPRSAVPIINSPDISSTSRRLVSRRHSLAESIQSTSLVNPVRHRSGGSGGSSSKELETADTDEDDVSEIDEDDEVEVEEEQEDGEEDVADGESLADRLVKSMIDEQIVSVVGDVYNVMGSAAHSTLHRAQYERILAIASGVAPGENSPRKMIEKRDESDDELEMRYLHSTPDNDAGGELSNASSVLSQSAPSKSGRSYTTSGTQYISHVPDRYSAVIEVLNNCSSSVAQESSTSKWVTDLNFYPNLPDTLNVVFSNNPDVTVDGQQSHLVYCTLLYHMTIDVARRLMRVEDKESMANKIKLPSVPSEEVLLKEVEREMLRAHPTVAHDAHIVVEHSTGIPVRVRQVSRSARPTTSASTCRAARMAQLCRVYKNSRVVRDTKVAEQITNNQLVEELFDQLTKEAIEEVTKNVFRNDLT